MTLLVQHFAAIEIERASQLDAIEGRLVDAEIGRFSHIEQQADRFFIGDGEAHLQPCAARLGRAIEELRIVVKVQVLRRGFPASVKGGGGKIPRGDNQAFEAWQTALGAVRGARGECRFARLIPKGDARVIVFALVPTGALVIGIFVRRYPAPMFNGYANAVVEDDRVVDMPPEASAWQPIIPH